MPLKGAVSTSPGHEADLLTPTGCRRPNRRAWPRATGPGSGSTQRTPAGGVDMRRARPGAMHRLSAGPLGPAASSHMSSTLSSRQPSIPLLATAPTATWERGPCRPRGWLADSENGQPATVGTRSSPPVRALDPTDAPTVRSPARSPASASVSAGDAPSSHRRAPRRAVPASSYNRTRRRMRGRPGVCNPPSFVSIAFRWPADPPARRRGLALSTGVSDDTTTGACFVGPGHCADRPSSRVSTSPRRRAAL